MISRFNYVLMCIGTFCFILFAGCADSDSTGKNSTAAITDSVITATYPNLYQAIYNRDAGQILPFTRHQNEQIRNQAWRGLAQTPIDSLFSFIEKVKQDNLQEAWFALSMHNLSAEPLRDLEDYWKDHPGQRAGISLVLGQQGDEQTFNFLADQISKATNSGYEQSFGLALSRLMIKFESTESQQAEVLNHAFLSSDPQMTRAWLYGFYRGVGKEISSAIQDSLYRNWKAYGIALSAELDQYVAKILAPGVFSEIITRYDSLETLNKHVQLGIELSQAIPRIELESNSKAIKTLLGHPNPHVIQQSLANLTDRIEPADSLYIFIHDSILNSDGPPFVWLQALNTLAASDPKLIPVYSDRLDKISKEYPYLYLQVLGAWMKVEDSEAFLNRITQTITAGDPPKSMYAINTLNEFWSEVENKKEIKPRVREIIFDALALADRGVTYSAQQLLQKPDLFNSPDFERINSYLNAFSLPGDIEVYQTFGTLYKERFEEQARPVVDSLVSLNYPPLNRSLKQAGWEAEVPDDIKTEFREPNWNRLWKLGEHPVWVLETGKGTIEVEMNTLSAPATVSAIDSLIRAGVYNDVPFHRVVPNFVIQGGDIERQDGFGGPDFTIPTEASELEYFRGAAGIASAGPDTEGSQYFFMHQWKPHLNGRYTLFGRVIEGMDVVDRIVVGDKVINAYWK